MEPTELAEHLRARGVVVHLAQPMPSPAEGPPGRSSIVVFLEETLGQHEEARAATCALPAVLGVRFSGYSRAVMFVETR